MPAVDPLDVLEPALRGPPTRHTCIRTRRNRPTQQRTRRHRTVSVAPARGSRRRNRAAGRAFSALADTRGLLLIQIWTGFRVRGTLRQGAQAKSLRGRAPSQRASNSSALALSEPSLAGEGSAFRGYLVRCGVIRGRLRRSHHALCGSTSFSDAGSSGRPRRRASSATHQ